MARNTDWHKVQTQGKVFKDQTADKQTAQANRSTGRLFNLGRSRTKVQTHETGSK